jgi:hypothetical protein
MKNKLIVAVTTIKYYSYSTYAETEDVAMDEFVNQSSRKFKKLGQDKNTEISDWIYKNKIKRKK